MWRPPERIRWKSGHGVVPSQKSIGNSRLFSPYECGRLKLTKRTWIPAMVPWRATVQGEMTDNVLDWYARFARGRPAAIVVEATGIRDIPSGPLLRFSHDRFLDGMKKLVERVKSESQGQTKLFVQLIDFLAIRRRPDKDKFISRFLEITPTHRQNLNMPSSSEDEIRQVLCDLDDDALQDVLDVREMDSLTMGYRESVNDIHLPHIRDLPITLPKLFAEAAVRAEQAGFDGIELHYAHAYTMASFLSATNKREDGYGGNRENRVKLALEVFKEVRNAVRDNFVVGTRFLSEEIIEGGSTLEDACYFATRFAEAGMDFISLSRGGKFDDAKQPKKGQAAYPYTGRSGYECMPQFLSDDKGPFGRNFAATKSIRNCVHGAGFDTPIIAAGGIHNFEMAENVLLDGVADIVGAARQSLADPDWFLKLETGHGDEVRLCEFTNYCEGLDQTHKQVTCKLWDRQAMEDDTVVMALDNKRRLTAPEWNKN